MFCLRLWALSPNVPEFTVSWHSQVAQAIMHKAVGVTAVATAGSRGLTTTPLGALLLLALLCVQAVRVSR